MAPGTRPDPSARFGPQEEETPPEESEFIAFGRKIRDEETHKVKEPFVFLQDFQVVSPAAFRGRC